MVLREIRRATTLGFIDEIEAAGGRHDPPTQRRYVLRLQERPARLQGPSLQVHAADSARHHHGRRALH